MKKEITLQNSKPFSINGSYFSTGHGFIKTTAFREWSYNIFNQLSRFEKEFAELRNYFDPLKHAYSVQLTAVYPRRVLFKKSGGLSSKTIDISNWEKSIIDCLCLPKHFEIPAPYGCKNLNIDDRFIIRMSSTKECATNDEYSLRMAIEIVNLPD